LLRDRSNGARGQRRRQKRRACRRKSVPSDCIATRTRDAWSTRAVLDSTSRSDLERSPLHDVKQHTPARRTWAGRGSFITSGRANRAAASAPFRCSQALKPSWRQRQEILSGAGDFARRPKQTRMADTGVGVKTAETTGHHAPEAVQADQHCADHRIATPIWWSQTGSNRRPPACKAGALPTELWPLRGSVIRHQ
jgi:hypothetical protein